MPTDKVNRPAACSRLEEAGDFRIAAQHPVALVVEDSAVDRAYVSRIERGLANPTIDVLERIALVLEVEVMELFRVPQPDEVRPQPLTGGRRTKR